MNITPLDSLRLKVEPLESRQSLTRVDDILLDPEAPPPPVSASTEPILRRAAERIRAARDRGAGVILIYGAHLLRNGAAPILGRMMQQGWVTHLATNGAGTIHDWEYAWLGRSTESVRANVATGTFGAWDETGRNIHLALLAGGLAGEGYGVSLGRFIAEDGTTLPSPAELESAIRAEPRHPSRRPAPTCCRRCWPIASLPVERWSSIAGSTRRSWPRRSRSGSRSRSTRASDTTSSPTTRCSTARSSGVRRRRIFGCSSARWRASKGESSSRSDRPSWGRRSSRRV
ncbi:MAG: hypothetical protein U0794_21245 [Isosphaeraceae bacterium]